MMADSPLQMATRYFTIFPDDIIPVWTVSGVVMGRVWTVSGVMGRRGGWTEWCVWCVMC